MPKRAPKKAPKTSNKLANQSPSAISKLKEQSFASGPNARIRGHVAAQGRRSQARKDSR